MPTFYCVMPRTIIIMRVAMFRTIAVLLSHTHVYNREVLERCNYKLMPFVCQRTSTTLDPPRDKTSTPLLSLPAPSRLEKSTGGHFECARTISDADTRGARLEEGAEWPFRLVEEDRGGDTTISS
jgi:hypothetical protein